MGPFITMKKPTHVFLGEKCTRQKAVAPTMWSFLARGLARCLYAAATDQCVPGTFREENMGPDHLMGWTIFNQNEWLTFLW